MSPHPSPSPVGGISGGVQEGMGSSVLSTPESNIPRSNRFVNKKEDNRGREDRVPGKRKFTLVS